MTFQEEAAAWCGVALQFRKKPSCSRFIGWPPRYCCSELGVLIRWEVLGTRQPEIEFLRMNDCQVVDNAWKFFSPSILWPAVVMGLARRRLQDWGFSGLATDNAKSVADGHWLEKWIWWGGKVVERFRNQWGLSGIRQFWKRLIKWFKKRVISAVFAIF